MKKTLAYMAYMTLLTGSLVLFLGLGSCSKVDVAPMLEIKVVTAGGQPAGNVMVGLFDDIEEWSMLENPVQPWRETGSDGRVIFNSLREDIYYFYADADSLSNISTLIKLNRPLAVNEKRLITVIVE